MANVYWHAANISSNTTVIATLNIDHCAGACGLDIGTQRRRWSEQRSFTDISTCQSSHIERNVNSRASRQRLSLTCHVIQSRDDDILFSAFINTHSQGWTRHIRVSVCYLRKARGKQSSQRHRVPALCNSSVGHTHGEARDTPPGK